MILCVGATPAVQRVMIFKKLEIDRVNRAVETLEGVAGKSVNVAKVLRDMGEEVAATGLAGGERGEYVRQVLRERGVDEDFVDVPAQTRLCVTLVDQANGTHTELVEESRAVPEELYERLFEKVEGLLPKASLLLLSGTLTPGAPVDWYEKCVRKANEIGVRAIVDTQGEVLRRTLAARPYLVKPNRAELGAALGMSMESDGQVIDGMKRLMEGGVGAVVISMGAGGALAGDANGLWRLTVPKIEAANPIGSGDAVTAGIAVGLVRGWSFGECCRMGMACGVANALTILAGQVNPEDVQRILPLVTLENIV